MTHCPSWTRRIAAASISISVMRSLSRYPVRVGWVDQAHRVVGVDVLREDEHADVWEAIPDGDRGVDALAGVGGRHADINQSDIGPVVRDRLEQRRTVGDGVGQFDPVAGQEGPQPVADQR
jgi:hypothetical protein